MLVHEADPEEIDAELRSALLNDAELVEGERAWGRLPGPVRLVAQRSLRRDHPERGEARPAWGREGVTAGRDHAQPGRCRPNVCA